MPINVFNEKKDKLTVATSRKKGQVERNFRDFIAENKLVYGICILKSTTGGKDKDGSDYVHSFVFGKWDEHCKEILPGWTKILNVLIDHLPPEDYKKLFDESEKVIRGDLAKKDGAELEPSYIG